LQEDLQGHVVLSVKKGRIVHLRMWGKSVPGIMSSVRVVTGGMKEAVLCSSLIKNSSGCDLSNNR
jgi:hypothetical protein